MDRLEGGYLGARPTWSTGASPGVWTLSQALARRAAGTWPATSFLYDPYFESVSLLLHMNGSNGSTTFVDSSLSNLAVTANGNAQISTAQSKFGGSSAAFDGAGDYLATSTTSAYSLGNAAFTIEAWVYISGNSSVNSGGSRVATIASCVTVAGSYTGWAFSITGNSTTTGTGIIFEHRVSSTTNYGYLATTSINQSGWNHLAVSRSDSTLYFFVNGILVGTSTLTNQDISTANTLWIGRQNAAGYTNDLNGYIDELRITRGVARYTANFTVPGVSSDEGAALYDPYFDYVSLLLRCNGANNSTTFTDDSNNAFAITPFGDTKISTTQARFGQASAFFDGTGDYLSVARNNAFLPVANEDFTFEAWIYMTATPGATATQIMGLGEYGTDSDWLVGINSSRQCYFYTNSNVTTYTNTTAIALNTWTHIAVSRSGTAASNLKVFINGVGQSFSNNVTTISNGNRNLTIGADQNGDESNFTGYIDDLRITKGVGRYTTDFRPVGPYATSGKLVDPYLTNTSLLLPMAGDNGNTSFFDRSNNFLRVTENGNVKVSTTQSKFGGTSAYFDGTGDFIGLGTGNTRVAFGSGDFTVEAWVYRLNANNAVIAMGQHDNSTVAGSSWILYVGSPTSDAYIGSTGYSVASPNPSTNTWAHVAFVRFGGILSTYLNGALVASRSDLGSGSINTGSTSFQASIGGVSNGTSSQLNGYIDDLRITKGTARYTTAFTPPERAFNDEAFNDPHYNNVSLLLHMDDTNNSTTFTDSSVNGLTVTANGDAKISTAQSRFGGASAYFDGTGDYLTASSPNLSGSWTVEFWVYPTTASQQTMVSFNSGGFTGINIWMNASRQLVVDDGQNAQTALTGGTLTLNTWNHVAIARAATTTTGYINGASVGSNSFTPQTTNTVSIGRYNGGTVFYYFIGYLDDLRITNSIARYTSNFTVPTLPFYNTTIPTVDSSFSSVSLLLHMDGSNGSTTFTDSSSNALAVTANGNAQISTAQSRFSGASAVFDGTGDYLSSTLTAFGTNDFTIEGWTYFNSFANYRMLYETRTSDSDTLGFVFGANASAQLFVYTNNTFQLTTGTLLANTWQHVALTRASGTWRIFINGILQTGTYSNAGSLTRTAVRIGMDWANLYGMNGYIDEYRITNGIARYTSNFYIPRAAFPNA